MITLVQADIVDTALEIAEEVGSEYVYQHATEEAASWNACYYVHKDPESGAKIPGCIVARILVQHGFSIELLEEFEGDNARDMLNSLRRSGRVEIDSDSWTIAFLQTAQHHQDDGAPWATAVQRATEYIESL